MNPKVIEKIKKDICKFAGETWENLTNVEDDLGLTVGDVGVEPEQLLNLFDLPEPADDYTVDNLIIIPTNSIGSDCSCEVIATYGLDKVKSINQSIVTVEVYKRSNKILKTKDSGKAYFVLADQSEG